nr:hypothetical protein BaRGS_012308 [Batillaria attramentaria]
MTTSNFYDFINTAKLYSMNNALKQIDVFIAKNLMQIARRERYNLLTFDQMWQLFLNSEKLIVYDEIDISTSHGNGFGRTPTWASMLQRSCASYASPLSAPQTCSPRAAAWT